MTQPMRFAHLSVLGSTLLDPAFDLISKLDQANPSTPNAMQSSVVEHTYSASIILICIAAVESCIRRLQYFHKDTTYNVLDYAEKTFSDFSTLQHLSEIFTVRDAVAHSHLWKTHVAITPPETIKLRRRKLAPGFGNKRFRASINMRTKKTKSLHLNLRPTSLTRTDVYTILDVVNKFFEYLEEKDPKHITVVAGRYFLINSKPYHLNQAVEFLKAKWGTG